ncbi:enoyl-CoA hydratase/isomerase family protein [Microbacterium gallinarum]|uniref:Enoyl-CoA hydratase/isomerase family protein n=1 Tax=Microbacterium gallinarum TaxID=2762209 RepID=A0ABR8X2Q9_9MICO|nr:enoyl-CoA hydratase-related protein [Microbacterium gallinarum]MBD8023580.1 enoyl-CoA hydratase/isomerase family protein [Microbacterium gallinarum]
MITSSVDEGVAEIVLDAPEKLNALSLEAIGELDAAYAEAEASGARALVLRGEGRAFCAGRDIAGVDPATDDVGEYLGSVEALMRRMAAFPAPTFAAVQGACLGVGLGLAIATDVVYVAETAKVGSPFANLGALLDSGGHALLYERLGAHRALDLIYTGELLTGAEAVAAGLFSRSIAADELLDFTRERAARAASGPTQAFLASKRLIDKLRDERLWRVVADETRGQAELRDTADYREGFAAFQQKRKPTFTGA